MILGILFPPAILLLDFRLGEEASNHPENQDSRTKDEDDKSSKVGALRDALALLSTQPYDEHDCPRMLPPTWM